MTLIKDIFERDVTRAIPPVVYFHEQEPAELQREVEEYIITGGYPKKDPRATEDGIHEQFVRLLTNIRTELDKPGGPSLPAAWISGFYGSGKSSFAKLLGLALDGRTLPKGTPLHQALLAQDHSPDAPAFRAAWEKLTADIKPIAVVFDVGSRARDDEHVHAVIVRQAQVRFGYSASSNLVAEYELKLELENRYDAFLAKAEEVHKKPWGKLKDLPLAEDYFSAVLHALEPNLYPHAMAWVDARSGSRFDGKRSADDAVIALENMIDKRYPGRTLFLVVDEVSQYVHESDDRMLALQSFVAALGQRMKGRGWLLATGQQKLDEGSGVATAVLKMKDRFPASLRVHLGISNIRDVVYKRLLKKSRLKESEIREVFEKHRADIALYAYQGEQISESDFVEMYPMLPGQIGLLLDITTGLRSRSTRAQGDSHAIRGLLQLLGDLFREKGLVDRELGDLITLDLIYDVLHTALDADVQMTLTRAMDFASKTDKVDRALAERVVKAVAMLELVQERIKTSAELVAKCLYPRAGAGNQLPGVQAALDALVGESLIATSEKTGYKIESSAGQEWQRERDQYPVGPELVSEKVRETLTTLMGDVDGAKLDALELPWLALYSDGFGTKDAHIKDERKYTVVTVDFQFTKDAAADEWIPRSGMKPYDERIVWVVGDVEAVRGAATKLTRSARMIERYGQRQQSSLADDKQRLLIDERNRFDAAGAELHEAVKQAFMTGAMYFKGRPMSPRDLGAGFGAALSAVGQRVVRELYPNPTTYSVSEKDIVFLIENVDLAAPPPVLTQERLGVLAREAGRYEATCAGPVPTALLAFIRENPGITGSSVLAHFGAAPYGVPPDVLRAAVVGLLRAHKLTVEIPGIGELTSVRDEGVRELVKETGLRKARLTEKTTETLSPRDRNAICLMFKTLLGKDVARDPEAIADAVAEKFSGVRERLSAVEDRFRRLPKDVPFPKKLDALGHALEACRRDRRVDPIMQALKRTMTALQDGLTLLARVESDLTDAAIQTLREADDTARLIWPSLLAVGPSDDARAAGLALAAHLASERPWEDVATLAPNIERVRSEYRARRRAILDAHAIAVDRALDALKRRAGYDKLDVDDRQRVRRHLSEGALAGTDEKAVAPALEDLEKKLADRRAEAEAKAIAELDGLLELSGAQPVIEIALGVSGREIETEAELARLLEDIRQRIVHELAANHRVRIK